MKKVKYFSVFIVALAVYSSSVISETSTITGGYAHGDMPSLVNKTSGFNLKYRREQENNNQLSVISSFTYTEKNHFEKDIYKKGQYYGISMGPVYRLNEWASIYGIIGVGYGKFQKVTDHTASAHTISSSSDYDFTYGTGLQFNPIENVAIDFSYEQSRIRNVNVSTWVAGVGYRF